MEAIGGYAEDLFLAEDFDYWLRCSACFQMARLPRDLYLYRIHKGSLTAQRVQAIAEAHERALCCNLPSMDLLGSGTKALAYLVLARTAESSQRRLAARKLFVFLGTAAANGLIKLFQKQTHHWLQSIEQRYQPPVVVEASSYAWRLLCYLGPRASGGAAA
jgi:hypothetical protein